MGRRRALVFSASLIAIVSVLLVCSPAQADWAKDIVNWIIAIFTKVLVYIIELLAYILIQLVDILIQIVQFNNFVKASPVRIGWPLMRDTVNMFFIIVVLVSAFATIIGYPKEFHYRGILPKLLIMAVLINFSKTLIGLMIDFSQVVVLTFVNGFKAAAGGNFVNALHIREVMNIEAGHNQLVTQDANGEVHINQSEASSVSIYAIFNMMLAAIFGIWMLSISITLIIIMMVFFLARIIILWFLLITSPVMFFAWALPGKLQKAFSAFTDQWWNRLSSALIGGPVMAFFLWLSLAIAQGSNGPDALTGTTSETALYKNQSTESANVSKAMGGEEKLGSIVVTEIGNSDNFANFIIMIAFMLIGVQFAVQSSQALAPKLGALAGSIAATGGSMGVGVAMVAAGARAAERATTKGAGWAGGKIAESRVGAFAARQALKIPGGLMTTGLRTSLGKAATAPQRAAETRAKELKAAMGYLPPAQQMKEWERLSKSTLAPKADKIAAVMNMTNLAKSSPFMKDQQKQERDDIVKAKYGKKQKYDNLSAEEKEAVDTEARQRTDANVAQKLQAGHDFAVSNNMTDMVDDIKKVREENPGLFANIKDIDSVASRMASDPEAERKMKDDSFMNMAFTLQYLKGRGFMNEKGNLTVDPAYDEDFKHLMRGRQGNLIASTLDYVQNTEEGRRRAQTILDSSKDEKVREKENVTINSNADGTHYSVALKPEKAGEATKVLSYNMGGFAKDREQITSGVSNEGGRDRVAELESRLSAFGGRSIKDIGRRLGTNKRAEELSDHLNTINTSRDYVAVENAYNQILQKGLMDANGLFGIAEDGSFKATGSMTADDNKQIYEHVVGEAYKNIKAGTDTDINMRVVASSMANTKGAALAAHGKVMQDPSIGYDALHRAMDTAVGEQAKQFRQGLKDIMNEAAVAVREQAAGATLSAAQKEQISNAEFMKGSKATTDPDKGTARRLRGFLSGRDNITVV